MNAFKLSSPLSIYKVNSAPKIYATRMGYAKIDGDDKRIRVYAYFGSDEVSVGDSVVFASSRDNSYSSVQSLLSLSESDLTTKWSAFCVSLVGEGKIATADFLDIDFDWVMFTAYKIRPVLYEFKEERSLNAMG